MCDWEGGGGGWGPIIIAYVRSPKWLKPNRTRKRTRNTIAMIGIARDLTQMRLRLFSSEDESVSGTKRASPRLLPRQLFFPEPEVEEGVGMSQEQWLGMKS